MQSRHPISRILVVGHKGMLGTDLMDAVRLEWPDADIRGADLPEVDIADPSSVQACVAETRPQVVINCAVYRDVDGCETQSDLAMAVNASGPGNLAQAAQRAGAHMIQISTDFVFDGRKRSMYLEDDEPNPLSVYGRTKLEGERAVMAAGGRWAIARTAWLYGRHGRNFVNTMLGLAREREEISVVTDKVGSPTWTRDLADALCALVRSGACGIYHTVNRGACSRFEHVQEILRVARLATRLRRVDSSAFPRPAQVPAFSPLDTTKLARDTGHVMRPWQEALTAYLTTEALAPA